MSSPPAGSLASDAASPRSLPPPAADVLAATGGLPAGSGSGGAASAFASAFGGGGGGSAGVGFGGARSTRAPKGNRGAVSYTHLTLPTKA